MSKLTVSAQFPARNYVILSDWDGTITTMDSNDYLTDNLGFGVQRRRELNLEVLSGRMTFRDAFREMLESIKISFEECKEVLMKNIKIDPGFKAFYNWCKVQHIPFVIVSSGMEPLIRAVLANLLHDDTQDINIISNSVHVEEDGSFRIVFRHPESGFGHDKSKAILPYRDLPEKPTLIFFGDGVSDMSAAIHADTLFVKVDKPEGQNDLAAYCVREGIGHIPFKDFNEALPIVSAIVTGRSMIPIARK